MEFFERRCCRRLAITQEEEHGDPSETLEDAARWLLTVVTVGFSRLGAHRRMTAVLAGGESLR